jgi:hypothetical protein
VADHFDSLVKRGLISDKVAERMVPTFADLMSTYGSPPSFSGRLSVYGSPPSENVEDRRDDPKNGYISMQATNNLIGAIARHLFPYLQSMDISLPEPRFRQRQAGSLREEAGYYDVNRAPRQSEK